MFFLQNRSSLYLNRGTSWCEKQRNDRFLEYIQMKRESAIAAVTVFSVVAFLGGFTLGRYGNGMDFQVLSEQQLSLDDSSIVPIGESPFWGADDAKATVVLFTDLTTRRGLVAARSVQEVLRSDLRHDVRLVLKLVPAGSERDVGHYTATAAMYAAEEGRLFGARGIYSALLRVEEEINRDWIDQIFEETNLDVSKVRELNIERAYSTVFASNLILGRSLGQSRGPLILINGQVYRGDITGELLKAAVFEELTHLSSDHRWQNTNGIYGPRVRETAELLWAEPAADTDEQQRSEVGRRDAQQD
jgi:protein-disulfide isomerase